MDNHITLESYQNHVAEYIDKTSHLVQKSGWIDQSLVFIQKEDSILEIGSGFGRDAKYIENLGYNVTCSDAANAFVEILKTKGLNAFVFNILTHNMPVGYKLVLANGVFLHFNQKEFLFVLKKCYTSLPKEGVLSFTLKQGVGETVETKKLGAKRYFCFWQVEDLKKVIQQTKFSIQLIEETVIASSPWITVILKK